MDAVLIVGAGGILAPAAAALVARGAAVTGVGRSRAMPQGVLPVFVDAQVSEDLDRALGRRRWSAAIVYLPAVSDASAARIAEAVDGRLVRVRMSAAADPASGEFTLPADTLQLGWTDETRPRWHTPDEVSAAALAVFEDGASRVLGAVRPWERRP
ncbi:hypothetical protein MRBLWO14_001445 [Microbacterium sp. LWO14-1.2]|uniref:hypothetical protein n=1 Tax=Microbacterium sp. LWO14-1.2 TaxID=3135263 RepID=UPI0031394323